MLALGGDSKMWGDQDIRIAAGSGLATVDSFSDWYPASMRAEAPDWFVNSVVGIEQFSGGRRAVARVEVIDAAGAPVPGVTVFASYEGSEVVAVSGETDAGGIATLSSDGLAAGADDALMYLFHVDAVEPHLFGSSDDEDQFPAVPGGFCRLSEGSAEVMAAMLEENPDGGIIFSIDPADGGAVCDEFDCGALDLTYNARSLGGGFSSSTVNVLSYDARLWGSGFSSSTVNALGWNWGIMGMASDATLAASAEVEDPDVGADEITLP